MDTCRICFKCVLRVDCEKCKLSCCQACYNLHLKECDKLLKFKYHLCERHGNQLEGYCCPCLQLTCDLCRDDNHKDHIIFPTQLAMYEKAKELEDASIDLNTMEIQINSLPDINRINIDAKTKTETEETKFQSLISDIKANVLSQIAEAFNKLIDPLQLHYVLKEAKDKLNCLKNQSFPITFLSEWACFSNAKNQCEKLITQQSEAIAQLKKNMNWDVSQLYWKHMINVDKAPVDSTCIKKTNDIDSLTSMFDCITLDDASNLKEQNADSMDSEGEFVHVDIIQEPQAVSIQREEDGNNDKRNLSEQLRQLQMEIVRMQKTIRLQTEEKIYIYNVCKKMNKLSEGITNWRTTGKHITIPETENTMTNTMVQNIELVLNRFIEVKNDLIKTEQQLKRKLTSIADWTDEVTNSTEADRKELLKELREKTAQINHYDGELRKRSMIKDLEPSKSELQKENGRLLQQNVDILKENEQLKIHLSSLYHENNTRIQKNQAETEALRNSLQAMKLQIMKKEQNLAEVQKERDDYQTRLSSVAGDKLTKGNPDITDLGDPNRPMKIGEMYGELYDNEWTDAMECTGDIKLIFKDLPNADIEEIMIHHLYRLLKSCFEECLLLAQKQVDKIRTTIVKTLHLEIQNDPDQSRIPGFKDLINLRRKMGEKYATFLFEKQIIADEITKGLACSWEYAQRNENLIRQLTKTPFFQKCVQLCWLMAIQDPVLFLSDEIQPNTVYDKNIYREYVASGDKVRYVVWPALFLHKNGPILYKGVVQPYS